MDDVQDPIAALAAAAKARHDEQRAVLAAVERFTALLYQAVETISAELVLRQAPGVAAARRVPAGQLSWLRFQWLGVHLAFVPHDDVALPPEHHTLDLRGRVGRVLLFHTERGEDLGGRVLRDYLIDAGGTWHFRGVARAEQHGPLDEATARAHVLQLLADLHANLRETWREQTEQAAFDNPNEGRSIGFHAE